MPDVPSISSLIEDLGDPDRLVRNSAVWMLMDLGESGRTALPSLEKFLDEESEVFIRLGAAGAISRIEPEAWEIVLPILLDGLHDNDFMNRDTACTFIGNIGPRANAAAPALMKLLDDETESVRCAASEAVGRVSGEWSHSIEIGLELLQSPEWLTRLVAAEHFEAIWIEAKQAIPRLRVLLGVVEWDVRLDVEAILAELVDQ